MEALDTPIIQRLKPSFDFYRKSGLLWTKESTIYYKLYGIVYTFGMSYLFVTLLTISMVSIDNFSDLSDVLSIYCAYVSINIRVIILSMKWKDVYALLKELKILIEVSSTNYKNFGYKLDAKMEAYSNYFSLFVYACYFSVHLTPLGFLITAILYGKPFSVPYIMWMPFDYKNNVLGFAVTLFYQYLSPFLYCTVCVSSDMLPAYFFSAIAGLFEELEHRISLIEPEFSEIMSELNQEAFNEFHERKLELELQNWVEIHRRILKMTKKVQEIFSPLIFVHTFVSSLVLCTTAYSMSVVS
jgi:hypothetical protein